ncbi:hypothetical protein TRFO_07244 [Tritrichomonas foetus]|uniref:Uncharacterized protein n=1 Tax=Tritrichomonas foetus TaxID=1144522 RepID=A0A1J4JSF7_9EUKA|nr:hypothetical protein TRFO_07244 [Tritrichomonas foetus]|eukprot:OHT02071.1 hypothetical protein TRFO_07244 [Tritrichomonas foetus]
MNIIKKSSRINHRTLLAGPFTPFFLIFIALITFNVIAPIFIPKTPKQPNIKDITAIIPNGGIKYAVSSLRTSGFRNVHAISYDINIHSDPFFKSYNSVDGAYGGDVSNLVNTSFVLYTGFSEFKVPMNLPSLPKKPMVIGYSFSQCYENGFALLLPYQLEGSMITFEAMNRFNDFSQNTLKHQTSQSEAFRIFADFHSLHLLLLPCNKKIKMLPKWETIEVVENETDFQVKPWDSIPKIEEVWRIRDML